MVTSRGSNGWTGTEPADIDEYLAAYCAACGATVLMLDSAEYVEDADMGPAGCRCGGETFNVAVGFGLYDDGNPRWVYLGMRCTEDGTLGVYADWKIDYTLSTHLFESV